VSLWSFIERLIKSISPDVSPAKLIVHQSFSPRSTLAAQRWQKEGPDHYGGTSNNNSHHPGPRQMQ
jgi:hypothetical protein